MKIPNGYQTVMPYLIVENAQQFIAFTQIVFNAKENESMRSVRENGEIMHSEVIIDGCTIMFADATEQFAVSNSGLFIYVPNADDAFEKALNAGAESVMELSDKHYGRTCGIKDPFGNTWWITSLNE